MSVSLFNDAHFRGYSAKVGTGEFVTIPTGNDRVSSIIVAPGYYGHFYLDTGFRGPSLVLFEGQYDYVQNWNDKISSMKIFEHDSKLYPLVSFYNRTNFEGTKQTLAGQGEITGYDFPFLQNDRVISMIVPEGVRVLLFTDSNLRGFNQEFGPGEYPNLAHFGFKFNITSVQIIRDDLELVSIEYINEVQLPDGNPIGLSDSTINVSDLEQVNTLTLERQITKSTTRSWSKSTMAGITITASTSVSVERGPLSAELETSISQTLENTFTIGEEETKSETSIFSKSVAVKIPPRSIGEATMFMTPKKLRVDAVYTFKLKGTENTFKQNVSIEVDDFQVGEAQLSVKPIEVIEPTQV